MRHVLLSLACLLELAACTKQKQPQVWQYPHNPAVSDARGQPRDTTTFYFLPADSITPAYVPREKRDSVVTSEQFETCSYELQGASKCLVYFQAPVLSNYYLGTEVYRFLWTPSFHRPVLITLQRTTSGATLRTQKLSKFPSFVEHSLPDPNLPGLSTKARARYLAMRAKLLNDTAWINTVRRGRERAVLVADSTISVSPEQWQQFERLLQRARFWQLTPCRPALVADGARWILEAHRAEQYHMVNRHSPEAVAPYRQACEYLLDLSPVRHQERY